MSSRAPPASRSTARGCGGRWPLLRRAPRPLAPALAHRRRAPRGRVPGPRLEDPPRARRRDEPARYARAILWDSQPEPAGGAAAHGASAAADDERRRGHLLGFMRREFGPPGHPRPSTGASAPAGRWRSPPSRWGRCTTPRGRPARHGQRRGPHGGRGRDPPLAGGPSRAARDHPGAGPGEPPPRGRRSREPRLVLLPRRAARRAGRRRPAPGGPRGHRGPQGRRRRADPGRDDASARAPVARTAGPRRPARGEPPRVRRRRVERRRPAVAGHRPGSARPRPLLAGRDRAAPRAAGWCPSRTRWASACAPIRGIVDDLQAMAEGAEAEARALIEAA